MESSPLVRHRWLLWLLLILAVVYFPIFTGAIVFFRDPAHWNAPARLFLAEAWTHHESVTWNPDEGLGFPVMGSPLHGPFYPPNWLFWLAGHRPEPRAAVAHLLTWMSLAHLALGSLGVGLLAGRMGCGRTSRLVAALAFGLSGYTTATWSAGLLLLAGAWIPWSAVGFQALVRSAATGKPRDLLLGIARAALPMAMAILMGEIFVALMGIAFGLLTTAAMHFPGRLRTTPRNTREPARALASHESSEAPLVTTRASRLAAGLLQAAGKRRLSLRLAVAFIAAIVLGVSLGAVTLLPARALVGSTQRGQPLPRELAESCSLHPLRLVEMLVPGAMGDALEDYPAAAVVGEPTVDGLPLAFSVYLGASVLALVTIACGRRPPQRLARRLGMLAVLALLVALGKHTPLHQGLRTVIPPLSYMRYPEKYLALFVPWVSVLAGLGAQRFLDEPARSRRLLPLALLLVGLAVLAFFEKFPAGLRPHVLRGVAAAAMALAALGATAWIRKGRPRIAAVALVITVALDLAAAAWPLQVFQSVSVAADVPPAARAILDAESDPKKATEQGTENGTANDARAATTAGTTPGATAGTTAGTTPAAVAAEATASLTLPSGARPRVYRADAVEATARTFVPVANIGVGEFRSVVTLVPNTATMFGLATVPGYDAAIPTSLRLLWARGEHSGLRLLQLLSVPYAVLAVSQPQQKIETRPGLTPLLDPLPGARLYRIPNVLPRIYLAGRADRLSERETFEHILDEDVITGQRALLALQETPTGKPGADDATSSAESGALALTEPGRPGQCALRRFRHDRVEAACLASRDAWAVFVEQYDQGWSATLDGRPTTLVRTNLLLRGVFMPAGEHRIVLAYQAPGLRWGGLVSGCALGLLFLCAAAGFWPLRGSRARAA